MEVKVVITYGTSLKKSKYIKDHIRAKYTQPNIQF